MSAVAATLLAAGAVGCLLVPRPAAVRLGGMRLGGPAERGAGAAGVARDGSPEPAGGRAAVARVLLPAVGGGLAAGAVAGPLSAVLVAVGVLLGLRVARARRRDQAGARERERAVEACAALAAELRAGRAPADALAAAAVVACGPSGRALAAAASTARLGGDVGAALRPPAGTAVAGVLRSLAACWSVSTGSGSGLAASVERLEEGLRADAARRRAVDAELAGPRATSVLLALLPAAGLLLASGLGADPVHVLLETAVGRVCLVGGLALDALGLWWTGRLVARATGAG